MGRGEVVVMGDLFKFWLMERSPHPLPVETLTLAIIHVQKYLRRNPTSRCRPFFPTDGFNMKKAIPLSSFQKMLFIGVLPNKFF